MVRRFSRRFFLSSIAALGASGALAAPPATSLRPVLRRGGSHKRAAPGAQAIIAEARLDGRVTFAVANAHNGKRFEGVNDKTGTPPASVAKALTALYALDVLGASYRFRTQLVMTGSVSNGILAGDLVLVGGADPTLDTNALAGMAAALKSAGIREVRGDFLVAEGMLPYERAIDEGQPDHVGYNPAISGIALNFNRVHFEWRRQGSGYGVSMDARSNKYRPDVAMARMQIADRRVPVYTYSDGGRTDNWTVARAALGNSGARWLPVRKPALYAGDVFQTLARSQGIVLKNLRVARRSPQGSVLVTHQSDPLRDILRGMLRYSTNITAEMVGMAATVARSGRPGSLRASATEMNRWASQSLGVLGMKLVDHSGLGDASRMTADGMVAALVRARADNTLRPILKAIPMLDANRRAIKDHPIEVHAKTGTLNFVSGLAGYMTARNGTEMAFAIFAADEATRSRISKANREAPQGARSWNRRAKVMQQRLIERWGTLYGS